jgi:hypothetical protein
VSVLDHAPAGEGRTTWRFKLTLRNNEASRRWYVLPIAGEAPTGPVAVTGWARERFADHVRANFQQFEGERPMGLLPVAGWGSAVLDVWRIELPDSVDMVSVWKLSTAELNGTRLMFEKKVPHDLVVADASARTPAGRGHAETLTLRVKERYEIPLTRRK